MLGTLAPPARSHLALPFGVEHRPVRHREGPDRMKAAGFVTRRWALAWLAWAALFVASTASVSEGASAADTPRRHVWVVPIDGTVDLGLAPLVSRVLEQAAVDGAAAVILDINTFGGRVDAAVLIRDALLQARVPTIAHVNPRAISAGALIALACEKVAISGGGTIGAATPVAVGAPGAAPAPTSEKTVSYMRKEFGATADARKRPTAIAEAMVDADVVVDGLVEKGKLLTLTTEEALKHRIADFRADSRDALLASAGLAGAEVRIARPTWAETLVRFLTHPVVGSLLMTIGIVGLITEIRTPGFGAPGLVGIASLSLFFWGHWLVQLAGLEELLLVGLGLVLLLVEVFVTPGFGVAGLLGVAALVVGLGASLVGSGVSTAHAVSAAWQVVISLVVALVLAALALRWLPRLPWGRRLVLEQSLPAGSGGGTTAPVDRGRLGRVGTAAGPLHPSGVIHLDGERVDVVSEGEFIDAGEPVEVVRVDGNRIVVRRHGPGSGPGGG
jgi:membrane-bound serine protease (ClpP class)